MPLDVAVRNTENSANGTGQTLLSATHRRCRFVGVGTFFLRENDAPGANAALEALLEPYMQSGIVNFDYWPGAKHPAQTNWYNECAKLAQADHDWVAFIDLDEFMMVLHACAPSHRCCACDESARVRPVCILM